MAEKTPDPGMPVFSRRVSLDDSAAFHGRIEADAAECARLAAFYKIESLTSFRLTYRIEPLSSHRYRLTGDLSAELVQLCVLTLEPVNERIQESIAAEFWPAAQIAAEEHPDIESGLDDDPPEPIIDGKIDVGAFAAEIFANAINPYPRKVAAEFVWEDLKDERKGEPLGPFAQLAKLRAER